MDRAKFSHIAHRQHEFYNPISGNKLAKFISLLSLPHAGKVIDFGAGNCELLKRLIERYKVYGIAVDNDKYVTEYVQKHRRKYIDLNLLQLELCDGKEYYNKIEPATFDLAVCLGAVHIFGQYNRTLQVLVECVKPGGLILIADAYWKKSPTQEFLDALGTHKKVCNRHFQNIEFATKKDLVPLFVTTANQEEWDEYEWLYCQSVEDYVLNNPEDVDCQEMKKKINEWRHIYLTWGRETLGFAMYLFRKNA